MRIRTTLLQALIVTLVAGRAGAANDIQTSGSFVSTVAPGTAPLAVDSTTRVDNLNAQYLDGWSAASFMRPLANVITVSPFGGDYTSIQGALDSITGADSANRFIVFVGPGAYDEQVTLKSYVTVIGAGRGLTVIRSGGSDVFGFAATVVGATAAGLRSLTIESDATATYSYAVGLYLDGAQPNLRDLEIKAYNGTVSSVALYNANNSDPVLVEDSEIGAINAPDVVGVYNASSVLELLRCDVYGYYGTTTGYAIQNTAASGTYLVIVRLSELQGQDAAVSSDSEFTTYLERVNIVGDGPQENGGTNICTYVTASSATGYASTCPP